MQIFRKNNRNVIFFQIVPEKIHSSPVEDCYFSKVMLYYPFLDMFNFFVPIWSFQSWLMKQK